MIRFQVIVTVASPNAPLDRSQGIDWKEEEHTGGR
jgi:hypothetical protein